MPGDRPVVCQEQIGNRSEAALRIVFIDADRLVAEITASCDDRMAETTQQEMMLGDSFPYDMHYLLSSQNYPFTSPELKERDWSKSVEPFVVTAMISGLIYLFFSNQSSD